MIAPRPLAFPAVDLVNFPAILRIGSEFFRSGSKNTTPGIKSGRHTGIHTGRPVPYRAAYRALPGKENFTPFCHLASFFVLTIALCCLCVVLGDFSSKQKASAAKRSTTTLPQHPSNSFDIPTACTLQRYTVQLANPIFLLCIYPIESSFPSVAEALST